MFCRLKALIVALVLSLVPVASLADALPAIPTAISTTATTSVKAVPGTFYGIISSVTQLTVVSCYDNPSALSGTLIYSGIPTVSLAITSSVPPVGIQFLTGLTCSIATSIVAPGYTVLWR